jgi:putative SOS response-associated peptidase YedK
MCGRFVGFRKLEELKIYFPIDRAECDTIENYNVAPTNEILAIVRRGDVNVLDTFHWGLVPHWAKEISIGSRMINARVESLSEKAGFREAFKLRRCLIVADGFYEWSSHNGQKQPFFITLPNKDPFAFAGLWDIWHDKDNPGIPYRSCTIITRDTCGCSRKIHNRMPAVLSPDAYDIWLDPENKDTAALNSMLAEKILTEFECQPVSPRVNQVRTNDPENIKPVQIEFDF